MISTQTLWLRKFRFSLSDDGIEAHTATKVASGARLTKITLVSYRDSYRDSCPRSVSVIAKRIIDHHLEYFVLGRIPQIVLHDVNDIEVLNLNQMFAEEIQPHTSTHTFKVREREFSVIHVRVPPEYENQHRICFCAHRRAVLWEPLSHKIPNLARILHDADDQRPFVYIGYISGPYLDETVTPERTSFYAHENTRLNFAEDVAWTNLTTAAVQEAGRFLTPFTDPVREEKEQQIRRYVRDRAPQYRPLLKHKADALNAVPPNLPDDKLDLELYKVNQSYETELKQRYQSLLTKPDTNLEPDAFEKQLEAFLEEWNELGMAKLAKHVVHRKATLSFLEASLGVGDDGRYKLENAIHKIIFPLKATSDDVKPDQMNLWILDEKLAYHHYLASDIPLNEMKEVVEIDSSDRPDVLIFHGTSAFADSAPPFTSLTLIEFKRPARTAYDDEDNPITQLYGYVRKVKAGKAKDRRGRPITVPDHIPIYAYIICDITPKLREYAENHPLTATPDLDGYFGYNPILKVYIEIISFNKLVGDAKQRNAVLFEHLGLV
jgi:hypothetical protein